MEERAGVMKVSTYATVCSIRGFLTGLGIFTMGWGLFGPVSDPPGLLLMMLGLFLGLVGFIIGAELARNLDISDRLENWLIYSSMILFLLFFVATLCSVPFFPLQITLWLMGICIFFMIHWFFFAADFEGLWEVSLP